MSLQLELGANDTLEFQRRFRAVIVADAVGYTRLIEAAELETHMRYRALRVEVIDPAIVGHRGELVKNTGDGFVAVFESPSDALKCATELQGEIAGREAQQSRDLRIAFRIGIHWEPVIFDLNDVYGRGVNAAARLQTAAPTGGIVVSSALLEAIGDYSAYTFQDLGAVRFKNLLEPIHSHSLALPGIVMASSGSIRQTSLGWAKVPSIAILPFSDLSPEADRAYFTTGFVEDIVATLSNLHELLVVSSGSTIALGHHGAGPSDVGEKLGVRYVLTGTVRRSSHLVRITAKLVDITTDTVLWAEKYDIGEEGVFDAQDDIALQISAKIVANVQQSEVQRALRKHPDNLNAYDYLLRALDSLYRLDLASFSSARVLLDGAIKEDPGYATPYAYAALWHSFNIAEGWSTNPDADASALIRFANCAIERDQSNPLALALLGQAKAMFFRQHDEAIELVDKAVAISPNNSWAWIFSSGPYGFIGETLSAISRAERAIRLSPLDHRAFFNYCLLGQNHYLHGSFQEAIRWSQKSLRLNPRFGNAARVLAASLSASGREDDALQVAAHHAKMLPTFKVSDYASRCPFKEPQASLYVRRLLDAGLPE